MPTLGDESQGSAPPPPPRPPFQPGGNFAPPPQRPMYMPPPPRPNREASLVNRTAFWMIAATSIGFLLPVCVCVGLCLLLLAGLTAISEDWSTLGDETGPAVGVIELSGPIFNGTGFGASTDHMRAQLEWMNENSDVRAIVIRANSPGGSVDASDEIWYEVGKINKPVVVSVQGLCASGCLYVASAADEIWATRSSLVGSIGVISTFFNVEELLDDVGVEVQVIATGENKDFGSPFRPMTLEEEVFWRDQSEALLNNFITVVASRPGSSLTSNDVRELANGRVWIAPTAQNLGLVDNIGYEDEAIRRAADLAGMGSYRVQEYPFNFGFLSLFSAESAAALREMSDGYFDLPDSRELLDTFQQAPLQYRYFGPYDNPTVRP
jgi:protease-4